MVYASYICYIASKLPSRLIVRMLISHIPLKSIAFPGSEERKKKDLVLLMNSSKDLSHARYRCRMGMPFLVFGSVALFQRRLHSNVCVASVHLEEIFAHENQDIVTTGKGRQELYPSC